MSKLADLRWTLVIWAQNYGHTLEECIDLVDSVEGHTDAIGFAWDDEEKREAEGSYESMKMAVQSIYNKRLMQGTN